LKHPNGKSSPKSVLSLSDSKYFSQFVKLSAVFTLYSAPNLVF
jgi:hypothetical protein